MVICKSVSSTEHSFIKQISKKYLVPSDPKSVGRCCCWLKLAHKLCRSSSVIRFLCMSIREQVRHHHGKRRQIDRWMGWTTRQMDIRVPNCGLFFLFSILQFKIFCSYLCVVDYYNLQGKGEESRYHSHCIYSRNYEKAIHLFIVNVSTQVLLSRTV